MSAGKLSRFAGSVFVLAAVLGGIGAVAIGAEHGTGGSTSITGTFTAPDSGLLASAANGEKDDITWG